MDELKTQVAGLVKRMIVEELPALIEDEVDEEELPWSDLEVSVLDDAGTELQIRVVPWSGGPRYFYVKFSEKF